MTEERWLTVADVADRLRLSQVTIRRLLKSGKLTGISFSDRGGYRISEDDLAKFLASKRGAMPAPPEASP